MVKPVDQQAGAPDRRQRILDAAGELIGEIGWSDLTTRKVAERAGVNNALIHYYFRSKDALLLQAASAVLTAEIEGPMAQLAAAPSLDEGLAALFEFAATIDERSPSMTVFVEAMHRSRRDEEVRAFVATIVSHALTTAEQVVARAQTRGEIRPDLDPGSTALMLAALLDGILFYRIIQPGLDVRAAGKALRTILQTLKEGVR